jgi:alpha-L-fucosidase
LWEACQTFSGSWGYHRDESTWRDVPELLRNLVSCVSNSGNLLLNVGPTSRGQLEPRALERLGEMGKWMRQHARAIQGCCEAPVEAPANCLYTFDPKTNRLYCHILAWPYKFLALPGLADRVAYAQFLHDGSEIKTGLEEWFLHQGLDKQVPPNTLFLNLPATAPHNIPVPVVELFLD